MHCGVVRGRFPPHGQQAVDQIAVRRGVEAERVPGPAGRDAGFGGDGRDDGLEADTVDQPRGVFDRLEGRVGDVERLLVDGAVVGEGERGEDLAVSGRALGGDLGGERGERVGAEGVRDLGLDAGEGLEDRGVGLCGDFGVFVVVRDEPVAGRVGVAVDQRGVFIVRVLRGEAVEGVEVGGARGDGVEDATAEERAGGEGLHVEASDDPEVVGAPFEGFEQVRGGCVDVDDLAVGEDKLVVDDVVAHKTRPAGEEGDAAARDETSDADRGHTAAWDREVLWVETAVHSRPSEGERGNLAPRSCKGTFENGEEEHVPIACANPGHRFVRVDRHFRELGHINGDTALLVGRSSKRRVSATFDRELAPIFEPTMLPQNAQHVHRFAHVTGVDRLHDALR